MMTKKIPDEVSIPKKECPQCKMKDQQIQKLVNRIEFAKAALSISI